MTAPMLKVITKYITDMTYSSIKTINLLTVNTGSGRKWLPLTLNTMTDTEHAVSFSNPQCALSLSN